MLRLLQTFKIGIPAGNFVVECCFFGIFGFINSPPHNHKIALQVLESMFRGIVLLAFSVTGVAHVDARSE